MGPGWQVGLWSASGVLSSLFRGHLSCCQCKQPESGVPINVSVQPVERGSVRGLPTAFGGLISRHITRGVGASNRSRLILGYPKNCRTLATLVHTSLVVPNATYVRE
jgi:hypothetical protein